MALKCVFSISLVIPSNGITSLTKLHIYFHETAQQETSLMIIKIINKIMWTKNNLMKISTVRSMGELVISCDSRFVTSIFCNLDVNNVHDFKSLQHFRCARFIVIHLPFVILLLCNFCFFRSVWSCNSVQYWIVG